MAISVKNTNCGKPRVAVRISAISVLHFWKFIFRLVLFLLMLTVYIIGVVRGSGYLFGGAEDEPVLMGTIWVLFVVEMIFRFFPSRLESMGCQKQFARNYRPVSGNPEPKLMPASRTVLVTGSWMVLNGVLGGLYLLGVYDAGILVLISLFYAVCDMICILWFCPFHTWMMKNKCCTTCRIYNWDYAMMFTPLIFIPGWFTYSLVVLSLLLLIKWEIIYHKHPERFAENANESLRCANCTEKLCQHKKQLRHYLKEWRKNNR